MSRAWLLVAVLWVVALLNYLDRQIIFSVLPLVQRDLGLSVVQLGLLGTAFLWVYGLASPVAGFLAERFGRKRVICVSLLVWSAVTWATSQARSLSALLWTRGLMGISEACYLPAALALIAEHHPQRTRSLATGIHISGVYAGMVLGGAFGGWAGERFGWRWAFSVLGAFGVCYTVVVLTGLRGLAERVAPPPVRPPRFAASVRELLRLPGFVPLTLVFAATSVANWVVYSWMPYYLFERFRISLTEAGVTGTLYLQIGSVAGILIGGWLADRWSARNPRGRILTQVSGLLVCAPLLMLAGGSGSVAVLIASFLVFGVGKGFYDCNAMPVLCQIARTDLRATGYGIFNMAGCIAGGAAAPLAGWLKSTLGLGGCFQAGGVILLLAALMLLQVRLQPAAAPETAALRSSANE